MAEFEILRKNAKKRFFIRIGMFIVMVSIIIAIIACLSFVNEQTQRHTIHSIDKVENTHGNSENFYTEVYYIVTTDKGIYRIEMNGFNAYPECAAVKKDSIYLLTTRGINFPFLGMYSAIIKYQNVNE